MRDGCQCEKCYHPITKQRLQDTFKIPENIAPKEATKDDENNLVITWNDEEGHQSKYTSFWLNLHSYNPVLVPAAEKEANLKRKLWNVEQIKKNWPEVDCEKIMTSDEGVKEWVKNIYEYGFSFVSNVPINPEATEKLCERIAYIKPTHYGGFWDFTADLAKNDTAYTNLYIASHTDGTYWSDTPGLQLFHMLGHDGEGGENMLVDGFACAEILKKEDPASYEFLSNIRIPAHSAGEEDVCIVPDVPRPVFAHSPVTGELVQVRWNNCDRSIMDNWASPDDVPKFYKAIRLWNDILTRKENEITLKLKPGQCLIFDNWRVLHGRLGFNGNRRMCGAYISRDDFVSKARLMNLGREAVIRNL